MLSFKTEANRVLQPIHAKQCSYDQDCNQKTLNAEAAARRCSTKKAFLKI